MQDIGPVADFAAEFWLHAGRLAVAVVCGVLLGIERERKDKPAGLRTIVLICVGSSLLMIISNLIPFAYAWPDTTRVDPSRIAEGIVTGIGFLGAGTIIQARGSVQGLTTAAVIWVAAGIGMCAGMGYIIMAFAFTGAVLLILIVMDPLRTRLGHLGHRHEISVVAPNDSLILDRIRYILRGHDVRDLDVTIQQTHEEELYVTFVYFGYGGAMQRLLEALAQIKGVHGQKVATE